MDELIEIVKNLGRIYDEENLRVNIDFDPNDGMTIVKFHDVKTGENTIYINSNNKSISGIDATKFWLPDYSNTQKANKRVLKFLEGKGYSSVNITYRKKYDYRISSRESIFDLFRYGYWFSVYIQTCKKGGTFCNQCYFIIASDLITKLNSCMFHL